MIYFLQWQYQSKLELSYLLLQRLRRLVFLNFFKMFLLTNFFSLLHPVLLLPISIIEHVHQDTTSAV